MLSDIENLFGFKYPKAYLEAEQDGMLDWGKQGPNWYRDVFPTLRKTPPLLLFGNDFRLLDEARVKELLFQFRVDWDNEGKYVPFGRTGAGDHFSFVFDTSGSVVYISKLARDSERELILARCFEDFLFRELLHAAYDINEFDIEEFDVDEFKDDLLAMLASHKKYLTPQKFKILENIYQCSIVGQSEDEFGMIDEREFFDILGREIGFDRLNTIISYRKL